MYRLKISSLERQVSRQYQLRVEPITTAATRDRKVNKAQQSVARASFLRDDWTERSLRQASFDDLLAWINPDRELADREKFLARYERTPEERRKLRIIKAIREYALTEGIGPQAALPDPKWRSSLSPERLRNPRFFIPVVAMLAIAFVVGIVWLVKWNNRLAEESNRNLATEQELAELNARPSFRENSSEAVSLVLPPISLRSAGPQSELILHRDIRVVELELLWVQNDQYPSYQAIVRHIGRNEQFKVSRLHIEKSRSGNAVQLRMPAHLLKDGLYQIILTGVRADGEPATSEEYSFNVGG
jgi:hypothetical protein